MNRITGPDRKLPDPALLFSFFLLSTSTLFYEINLTRLFSVSQFYHFAFMIVSLALLGFGASGTFLYLFPQKLRTQSLQSQRLFSSLTAASMLGAFMLINDLPFDSYSIAWDWRQLGILVLHYIALATPFFFCGTATGMLLIQYPGDAGKIYAFNLIGSAVGCLAALSIPIFIGGEGVAVLCSGLSAFAALITFIPFLLKPAARSHFKIPNTSRTRGWLPLILSILVCVYTAEDLASRLYPESGQSSAALNISPYKGLSYALQHPQAVLRSQKWNAYSRIDVIDSPGIRSLPGLSILFMDAPPAEYGLFTDGDNLSPIIHPDADMDFTSYMSASISYQIQPDASVLILDSQGGLDISVALKEGARIITAVESNPLIVESAPHIYQDNRVHLISQTGRSYLNTYQETFDVIILPLNSTFHPVNSGAYSLIEDYRYTVESFQAAIDHLEPEGLLLISRWLQIPPSEWLRTFALAVTALENNGLQANNRIVALRGYNLGSLLIKPTPFTKDEVAIIKQFAADRSYDMVYAPDISKEEINRHNILPQPIYFEAFSGLLLAENRDTWYAAYNYDIRPPTDDRPFSGHYFKWSQTKQILAELGKSWQPFGGAGYFVILLLLLLSITFSSILILLPVAFIHHRNKDRHGKSRHLIPAGIGYFGLIGLGFMLVEIPLIQQFILFLEQPAYALTSVLFTLLLFSGVGSRLSHILPHRAATAVLSGYILSLPWILHFLFNFSLGFPLNFRLILTGVTLAPLGLLMGIQLPRGIMILERTAPELIPWAWGVNGAASVISSVLAAFLSLSFGFRLVLLTGAASYACAGLIIPALKKT